MAMTGRRRAGKTPARADYDHAVKKSGAEAQLLVPDGNDRSLAGISPQPTPASFPPTVPPATLADHIAVQEAEEEIQDQRALVCPASGFHTRP